MAIATTRRAARDGAKNKLPNDSACYLYAQRVESKRHSQSGYIPSLDGWRAIAILAVIMDHDGPWSFMGHSNVAFYVYGGWGVFLFFAISGFLVCTRILEDEAVAGSFDVRAYYIRRFLRIQPAAFCYLGVIALLTACGVLHQTTRSILGALFLYQNYLFDVRDVSGGWFMTGHFWTLALEEHFYLILSLLLVCFKQSRIRVFAGLLILLFAYQQIAGHLSFYSPYTSARRTELNIQYLLTPALLALLLQQRRFKEMAVRYLHPWVVFAVIFAAKIIVFVVHPELFPRRTFLVLYPADIWFYGFSFLVIATVFHRRSWTTRFLELKPLRYIGRWSYSIYLWHALFIAGRVPQVGIHAPWLLVLTTRPWRYVATAVMSLASYYFVEKPFVRLGHRLAPPATPGHADLAASSLRAAPHAHATSTRAAAKQARTDAAFTRNQ